ncbi:NACHT domain-containing protein [Roseibium polysiphoniae]|uniref:NACHT domain-containing protein n=1 Tax=Roseibium polysiphoniae TaxID=2571221 RepID=A0A944GQB1_9HYPH|nr:NACHT domain-containing protein [Roseibium polysiphoniae]MBS8258652.1 NACHT domain-containing protein [Roseibium polysiphoniae]
MTPSLEITAANAALNQSKSIVDAILGPKINRIKKWAHEKDVKGRISEEKLGDLFKFYLERAITSAESVQSIVFPQSLIPLQEIYEPLYLRGEGSRRITFEEIINTNKNNVTIIDHAGMGKSTFSKSLFLEVCKSRNEVPIIFNLRNYDRVKSLILLLKEELDEVDGEFDSEIFTALLKQGRFIIILDGFDEVNPLVQSDVRREIEEFAVRIGNSKIILTSRPQDNIPVLIGSSRYSFEKLSLEKAKSIVRKYDAFANIEIGERLIKQISRVPSSLLESPLLVALLYKSFGTNNEISQRLTSFYSDTYSALFKGHDLTKAGFSREKRSKLNEDEFRQIIRALAFCCIATQKLSWLSEEDILSSISKAKKMSSVECDIRAVLGDLLSAVPLLIKDGREIRFIHKTFIEFFAAEFIEKAPNSESTLQKIIDSPSWRAFSSAFEYLEELSPSLSRTIFLAPIARYFSEGRPSGELSLLEVCHEAFDWYFLWSSTQRKSLGERYSAARIGERDYAVIEANVIIGSVPRVFRLMAARKKEIEKSPKFAIDAISRDVDVHVDEKEFGRGRNKLGDFVKEYAEGKELEISHEDLRRLYENEYFKLLMIHMVQILTGDEFNDGRRVKLIDVENCRKILKDEEDEAQELRAVEDILQTVSVHG